MYCNSCGEKIPEGSSFCTNCGTAVEAGGQNGSAIDIKRRARKEKTSKRKIIGIVLIALNIVGMIESIVDGELVEKLSRGPVFLIGYFALAIIGVILLAVDYMKKKN